MFQFCNLPSFPVTANPSGFSGDFSSIDWLFFLKLGDSMKRVIAEGLELPSENFAVECIVHFEDGKCIPLVMCSLLTSKNVDATTYQIVDQAISGFATLILAFEKISPEEFSKQFADQKHHSIVAQHALDFLLVNGGKRIPVKFSVQGPSTQKIFADRYARKPKADTKNFTESILTGKVTCIDVVGRNFTLSPTTGIKRTVINFDEKFSFEPLRPMLGEPMQHNFHVRELLVNRKITFELIKIVEANLPDDAPATFTN